MFPKRWWMGLALFVALVVGYGLVRRLANRERFDPDKWRESGSLQDEPWPRLGMADDLLRRNLLDGLSEDSLISLLGPKPETDYFREYDYVYWLGPERGWIRIDSEWLVIKLDSSRHVATAEIVRD